MPTARAADNLLDAMLSDLLQPELQKVLLIRVPRFVLFLQPLYDQSSFIGIIHRAVSILHMHAATASQFRKSCTRSRTNFFQQYQTLQVWVRLPFGDTLQS